MEKPFVLPIKTPLGKYFYEVNRNEIVKVNDELFEYIQGVLESDEPDCVNVPEDVKSQYYELIDCGYLSSHHVEDILHPMTSQVELLLSRGLNKLILQVTQSCNLRCAYCVYSEQVNPNQRTHSRKFMTIETARSAIDFFRKNSIDSEELSIGFYGGEPLLAFSLIKDTVKYAEEQFCGRNLSFAITTNATLLTDEIIDFLVAHDFKITFSLDGPQTIQDKNRVFRDGRGSYEIVMQNIQKTLQRDPKKLQGDSLSMVITPSHDYNELTDFLNHPSFENVAPLASFVEEDFIPQMPSDEYMGNSEYDHFLALVDYFRKPMYTPSNKLIEQDMLRFESDFFDFTPANLPTVSAPSGPCVPGKSRLFVNCFGDFYPCERVNESETMKIGSLKEGFNFENVIKILNVSKINLDRCKNCFAFPLCSLCGKMADDGKQISQAHYSASCKSSRNKAFSMILEKIVNHENAQHMRDINYYKGN